MSKRKQDSKRVLVPVKRMMFERTRLLCVLMLLFLLTSSKTHAQLYDLLLKGGHVIDAKNKIDQKMDVAVAGGKIARVAPQLDAAQAKKVIDVKGLYVTPGLIDLHTHVFVGSQPGTFANGFSSVSPDDFTFRSAITTVVDAGTSGWQNFPDFKKQVIDPSQTRVLAFLNIAGSGMQGPEKEQDLNNMDVEKAVATIRQYGDLIVGVKLGHYSGPDWTPFQNAIAVGNSAKVPLLLECHLPQYELQELLQQMRPGDVFTHSFGMVDDRESVIDEKGKVRPYVLAAREKGIQFDVGHGGGSFHFSAAIPALQQGLLPDAFGTDLHRFSMNAGMKDMLNVMSKYLNMGMDLSDIIFRASWNPAQIIHRSDLGHLSEGAVADIAVLSVRKGSFGFVDSGGKRLEGNQKLEAELTIRAGKIVWDLNGLAAEKFK